MCTEICSHPYRNSDGQHRRTTNLQRKHSKKPLQIESAPDLACKSSLKWRKPRGCPTPSRVLRGRVGLLEAVRGAAMPPSADSSFWPLNCSPATNCRRARVTLPVMSYFRSNVRASCSPPNVRMPNIKLGARPAPLPIGAGLFFRSLIPMDHSCLDTLGKRKGH